ncbi:MAG: hypothetical protein ABIA67_01055 [Candidatus Margulisiibacteriota bacterium]
MTPGKPGRLRAFGVALRRMLAPRAKTNEIKIKVAQLTNLSNYKRKIGPLSGKKWHSLLVKYFEKFLDRSFPPPRKYFKDLSDLLTYSPHVQDGPKFSLAQQFTLGFRKFVEKYGQLKQNSETNYYFAVLFLELTRLSIVIKGRQAKGQDFGDIIEKANRTLADTYSEPLSMRVKIIA